MLKTRRCLPLCPTLGLLHPPVARENCGAPRYCESQNRRDKWRQLRGQPMEYLKVEQCGCEDQSQSRQVQEVCVSPPADCDGLGNLRIKQRLVTTDLRNRLRPESCGKS